ISGPRHLACLRHQPLADGHQTIKLRAANADLNGLGIAEATGFCNRSANAGEACQAYAQVRHELQKVSSHLARLQTYEDGALIDGLRSVRSDSGVGVVDRRVRADLRDKLARNFHRSLETDAGLRLVNDLEIAGIGIGHEGP